jgi:hypothetical protein
MNLAKDEILLRESRGNHRANNSDPFGWVGGRWFLTNYRLLFKSNIFNTKKREESIPLKRIISIRRKHSDFMSSRLVIFVDNGSLVELNVPNRKEWINDIGMAMKEFKKDEESDWDVSSIINTQEVERPSGWLLRMAIQLIIFSAVIGLLTFILLRIGGGSH